MTLIGEKVKSKILGVGTVTDQTETMISVSFPSKTSKFVFPDAFENHLEAENPDIQVQINILIKSKKEAAAKAKLTAATAHKARTESQSLSHKVNTKATKEKDFDRMFPDAYHVNFLAQQPILTYQQVEKQFGIKISGFGKGINPTPTTVVLISSIGKTNGAFVYHDHWTADGNYLYSGEGRNGDQSMTKGNLAIKNAQSDGKVLHLFIKFSPQEYYYQGTFELVSYSYETEKDETGSERKEYKFLLRKVSL